MSSTVTQDCWVCGKATTERCSACGKTGMFIFFCSSEHQKLVWPIHRKFCGPGRTKPFLLPSLTREEADEAKANLEHKFRDMNMLVDMYKETSLQKVLAVRGYSRHQAGPLIDSLVGSNKTPPIPSRAVQYYTALVRSSESQRRTFGKSPSFPKSPADYAIQVISTMVVKDLPSVYVGDQPFPDLPWLPVLLHRAAFHYFLFAHNWASEAAKEHGAEEYTEAKLRAFMEEDVKQADSETAEYLLASFKWNGSRRQTVRVLYGGTMLLA
ncbi:hypothetical protein JCM8097_004132 [Rhodosporidiobolus ruineniae]